jgi:hypothetical protein
MGQQGALLGCQWRATRFEWGVGLRSSGAPDVRSGGSLVPLGAVVLTPLDG